MRTPWLAILAIGLSVAAVTSAQAQQSGVGAPGFDRGKYEYRAHCVACHGLNGEGDGPYAAFLNKPIPNLATLAKRNNGVFPFALVYETIDGTQVVAAHGARDMPIWGPRYRSEAAESRYDDFRADYAAFVRARILALTEYVFRLQAK